MESVKVNQPFNTSSKWFSFFSATSGRFCTCFAGMHCPTNKQHYFGHTCQVFLKLSLRINPKNTPGAAFLSPTSKAGLARSAAGQITEKGFSKALEIQWKYTEIKVVE